MSDRCYFEEHRFLFAGIALGWYLAFVFLGNVARFVLLVGAIWAWQLYPHVGIIASAEAGAVSTLRKTAASLHNYQQNHYGEGFRPTIPSFEPNCWARSKYEFQYRWESELASGNADKFILIAVPVRGSRGLRSFALTEDGHLHATDPDPQRPANRADREIQ